MTDWISKLGLKPSEPQPEEPQVTEAAFSQEEVFNLAKTSVDFLSALAMPTIYSFALPPVLLAVWDWLVLYIKKERDFSKLALGLPRGFAKTTLIKVFILYCILFTSRKFILIICANASLAQNILADVQDMLNEPNIIRVFGDWKLGLEKDTLALKKFGFRGRNIILAGLGQGGSLRGLNIKNERPDVMIFEDIQTREDAESQVTSEAIERWMFGTAMKAKSPLGCLYIFVANMYPTKWSLLKKLKHNPQWVKFIAGGILADGTSLWEDLHPIEILKQEFLNDLHSGHPEIFHSEVMNDENASINTLINISKIPVYPYDEHEIPAGKFLIIDPASDKVNSDAVSIGYFEVIDGLPVCKRIKEGRFSPGDTIRESLQLCFETGANLVVIESNAYQYSLNYWFDFICTQMGVIGIQAVPIYSGSLSKNSRILTMFKSLLAGEIYIHPSCMDQVTMQIVGFNPLKTNNTDGILDLLTYAPRVITEMGEFLISDSILGEINFSEAKVMSIEHNSAF